MSSKKSILFVVNPISGTKGKLPLEDLIPKVLNGDKYDYSIYYTSSKGDAIQKSKSASEEGVHIIVAVGGDGTINEVAQGILGSDTVLGVLPKGSGNGFANYLNIPQNPTLALERINDGEIRTIDVGLLNKKLFLSVAGFGFDARVSNEFDNFGSRGLLGYIIIAFREYFNFKPSTYTLNIDGKTKIERSAFLVTAANSSQFGNNAVIAPKATMEDGLLDLVIVRPLKFWSALELTYRLFSGTMDRFSHAETIKAKHISITHEDKTAQVDGEPLGVENRSDIEIVPKALSVLV